MDDLPKIEMRKLVPVAAKISAGKSKLLNTLYNIDFLECSAGIGTKFINILRYNPKINTPCFYHLILKKEGENLIFYKDINSEIYEGEDNIIKANKEINKSLYNNKQIKYEDLFYMTEICNTPFIEDKDYLMTHDLCDIPGLSEYQDNEEIIKKEEEKKVENNKKMSELDQIKEEAKEIGLVCDLNRDFNILNENKLKEEQIEIERQKKENNNEDDIYNSIKDDNDNKTYINEIFKIIKNYIEGGIILLSVDNFHSKDNYLIIANLYKVIQKPITNFLILLNKMDLSQNQHKDINDCKGLFTKYFPKFKTFNLNLNTFVPISVNQLKHELLMKKNFQNLIYYHFYNYISNINQKKQDENDKVQDTFITHLKKIMEINEIDEIDEIISKVKELNNSKNISEINKEIISIIKNIENDFKDKELRLGIFKENINNNNVIDEDDDDDDEDNNSKKKKKKININNINPAYILKYFYKMYIDENKEFMPPLSEETKILLNYFRNNKKMKEKYCEDNEEPNKITLLNKQITNKLKNISNNIKNKFKFDEQIKEKFIKDITNTIESLNTYNAIFIPFLGEINSGKSTIINGIIGDNILPTGLKECTKRGIIIRYSNNDTTIRKANFKTEIIENKVKYYIDSENEEIIGKGREQVKDILKGLNYDFNSKEEDSFYFIKTKIKLFDEMGLDYSLKKKIYLIDLPGFGTENIFEKAINLKLMSICNSFIFTVRNSVIKENNQKLILNEIFQKIKEEKKIFSSSFMKSCLFVLNNDENQTTTKEDLQKARNDISELTKVKDNINLCFYNAKRYLIYCNNYNYYYNLENTLANEYKEYLKINNDIYKNPDPDNQKKYNSFCNYLDSEIKSKNKYLFNTKKIDYSKKDENVDKTLTLIFEGLKIDMNSILKYQEKIAKSFSFGREKIQNLDSKKESNYNIFKEKLNSIIYNINNDMQKANKEKISNILKILDSFFSKDFHKEKNNEEIKIFENKIKNIKSEINTISTHSQEVSLNIIEEFKENIKKLLNKRKENINNYLKDKKSKEILEEINKEIEKNLEELNNQIIELINNINDKMNKIISKSNYIINDFFGGKGNDLEISGFSKFLSSNIRVKESELTKEIYNEMIIMFSSTKIIYEKKGFKSWFISSFSNVKYLENIIDIILCTILSKMEYILIILIENICLYIKELIQLISQKNSLSKIKYTKEYGKILDEITKDYEVKRAEINEIQKGYFEKE